MTDFQAETAMPIGGTMRGENRITVWRLERRAGLPAGLYLIPLARPTWVSVQGAGGEPIADLPRRELEALL